MTNAFPHDQFKSPAATYRSKPLWVWNNQMTPGRIEEMIAQYDDAGMGGVFVHPRPGLVTTYLTDEWFALWGKALEECRKRGMECNVYDENSYPSGFAGGNVPARIPDSACQMLRASKWENGPFRPNGQLLAAWSLAGGGHQPLAPGETIDAAIERGPVLTVEKYRDHGAAWTAWMPYTDLSDPRVADVFIDVTHAQYEKHFGGEFGKTINAFFTDEPHLASAGHDSNWYGGFPYSNMIAMEFRHEHGYRIEDKLEDLFFDTPGCHATRFDYYHTINRLFIENFVRKIYDWCAQRGVSFTGHFMEHDWPYPFIGPDCLQAYQYMHIPGIDLLMPQYPQDDPKSGAPFLLTVRELNSSANQCSKQRRFCEAHGVGGYEATFLTFKRLVDWLMVHGVNYLDEHLSYSTIAGPRKYDHPQTFSDHAAWWPHYRIIGDYQARVSALLSHGDQENRVLVLQPTTTGWIRANPTEPQNHPLAGPVQHKTGPGNLRDSQAALTQFLCDNQVDFDFGDEYLIEEHGRIHDGRFHVGAAAYDVVVVPEMDTGFARTAELLAEFLQAGGTVVALADAPRMVRGRKSDAFTKVEAAGGDRWVRVSGHGPMLDAIDAAAPRWLTAPDGGVLPDLLHVQRRRYADGSALYFIVNTAPNAVACRASIAETAAAQLDPFTGGKRAFALEAENGRGAFDLHLEEGGSLVLVTGPAADGAAPAANGAWTRVAELSKCTTIERDRDNVLGIDYCDLVIDGRTDKALYCTEANRRAWQAHGHDRDVWDRGVQLGTMFIDRTYPEWSGFEAHYHFEMTAEALAHVKANGGVRIGFEHPEQFSVTVNGKPVDVAAGERWFDEVIRIANATEALVAGRNTVVLKAAPFTIFCSLDRVYVLGDFAVDPAVHGFRIDAPRAIGPGDWRKHGLAQYHGAVRYTGEVEVASDIADARIRLGEWRGIVARVSVDGGGFHTIAFPPYAAEVGPLAAGTHSVTIEVVNGPRNLLGPHLTPMEKPIAGPGFWDLAPNGIVPPGNDYRLEPYGLMGGVTIEGRG